MNKSVIVAIVVIAVFVGVYLVVSSGKKAPAAPTGQPQTATPAAGAQVPAPEAATSPEPGTQVQVKALTEAQIREVIRTMPKDGWASYPDGPRKQIEDYARQHPELVYQGAASH